MDHRRSLLIALLGLLAACGAQAARHVGGEASPAEADVRYHVTLDGALSRASVRACFDDPPARLVPGVRRGGRFLIGAWREGAGQRRGAALEVEAERGAIDLEGLPDGGCLRYVVDLRRLADEGTGRHDTWTDGAAMVLNPDLLLWRPMRVPGGYAGTVSFALAAGQAVSSPWPVRPTGGEHVLNRQAFQGTSRLVVGAFERLSVQAAGARLEVAVVGQPRRCTPEGVRAWLRASVEAVALVHGEAPVPRMQIIVVAVPAWPGGRRGERPVAFGMALRGGGPSLLLLVSGSAEDAELPGEWIAIHEAFHLGMPAIARADVWLSEGVTMYYSETLRGRAGFLTPREAWQRLDEGFRRGRSGGTGRTLAEESAAMHETSAYMRVYWGGAAIALAWDVALRRASGGERSLDDALRHLRACCLSPPRTWTAEEVMAELDRWWGEPLFTRIARHRLASPRFVDQGALYEALGLRRVDEAIQFVPGAPDAAIRDGITGGAGG